jgi:hypothetical protein
MAEGLVGGALGDEEEKPEVEVPGALVGAEAFAAAVAAIASRQDPEVARDTSAFLKEQTRLLQTQRRHLDDEHALRMTQLGHQSKLLRGQRIGQGFRIAFQVAVVVLAPALPEARIYKPSNAQWLIARDGALLQFLPAALVANYWKIEVTREHTDAVYFDARRSRVKLNALLDVYAGQSALNSTDVLTIRLALNEYAQFLRQVKALLQHVAEANEMTLNNKVIGIGMAAGDLPLEPGR